jgi:aldose 1-epimerase
MPVFGQYSTSKDGDVIRLEDGARQTVVSVTPSRGNNALSMKVKGHEVLGGMQGMSGIPFLAPWANRLDEQAFYANGKKYPLNMGLGNVRGQIPMHGVLQNANQWEVVEAKADGNSAWVTSRLEFYRNPDWMAQFPFAHTIEMTHRLHDGTLEVAVKLTNLSTAPMPVSIGFHSFFQVDDAPRDEWTFRIGARTEPIGKFVASQPEGGSLKGVTLDDLFNDLIRDADGKATMWLQGKSERVEVSFGPNYKAVVSYFPAGPNQNFICFEPMAGITDAMNMAQKGTYKELQSIPPGGTWQESFWIRPSGY